MALFWSTEVFPLEVTSLLPLVMLPMLGIMNTGEVSKEYFNGANMLLLAAMGVAAAAQVKIGYNNVLMYITHRMLGSTKDWH